jgi:hypothetical protein
MQIGACAVELPYNDSHWRSAPDHSTVRKPLTVFVDNVGGMRLA